MVQVCTSHLLVSFSIIVYSISRNKYEAQLYMYHALTISTNLAITPTYIVLGSIPGGDLLAVREKSGDMKTLHVT